MMREPIALRQLDPDVPVDLESICLKCLEKDPKRRYRNMEALAHDLNNFLKNRPVAARPLTRFNIALKWFKRNKTSASICAFFIAIIVVSIVVFIVHLQKERDKAIKFSTSLTKTQQKLKMEKNTLKQTQKQYKQERDKAVKFQKKYKSERDKLREAQTQLQIGFYPLVIALADKHSDENRIDAVAKLLSSQHHCPPNLRHWEWSWIYWKNSQQMHSSSFTTKKGINIKGIKAINNQSCYIAGLKGIWLWNKKQKFPQKIFSSSIQNISFDTKSRALIFSSGHCKLIELGTNKIVYQRSLKANTTTCAINSQGNQIIILDPYKIKLIDFKANKTIFVHERTEKWFLRAKFNPNGLSFALINNFGELHLWDIATKTRVKVPSKKNIFHCVFSADGKFLCTISDHMEIWNSKTRKLVATIKSPGKSNNTITTCAFDAKNKLMISGGTDKLLKLWQINPPKLLRVFKGHAGHIKHCVFIPDSNYIVSGDSSAHWWNIKSPANPYTIKNAHLHKINHCVLSPNQAMIASASSDMSLKLWDINTNKLIHQFIGHTRAVTCCAFNSDGKLLASASRDKTVKIWEIKTRKKVGEIKHFAGVTLCVFDKTGKKMITCTKNNVVRLWDIKTKKVLYKFNALHPMSNASFAPNNRLISL